MKIILGPNLHRGAPPHNYGPLFFGPWVAKFGPGVAKFCPGGPRFAHCAPRFCPFILSCGPWHRLIKSRCFNDPCFSRYVLILDKHCIYAACLSLKRCIKRSYQSKVPSIQFKHCFFPSLLFLHSSAVFTHV